MGPIPHSGVPTTLLPGVNAAGSCAVGEHMKTSIFDATFTLPPMVVMTQVEKDMPQWSWVALFKMTGNC